MTRLTVDNISKSFGLRRGMRHSFLSFIFSSVKLPNKKVALDNVSFEVAQGENVGIIGHNGSGKSTLIKIIAGIYQSDSGTVVSSGKMVCLSGVGRYSRLRFTMRDAIYFYGAILGLSKAGISAKINLIADFAELSDYLDIKLYQFSSGMLSRLSFSIWIHALESQAPDIILLDEFFTEGCDEQFKTKSLNKIKELVGSGSSTVIVSHDMSLIKQHCDKTLWLDSGRVVEIGKTDEVVTGYLNWCQKN